MTVTESYLAALLVILSLPWALWRGLGRPGWAPLVVVQIVLGIRWARGCWGGFGPRFMPRCSPRRCWGR